MLNLSKIEMIRKRIFRYLYDLPEPLNSWDDFQRLYHLDLQHMDDIKLWQEQKQVKYAISLMTDTSIIYISQMENKLQRTSG